MARKIISKEIKFAAVEYFEKGDTPDAIVKWIKETHGIEIHTGTVYNWRQWAKRERKGANPEIGWADTIGTAGKRWTPIEDAWLTEYFGQNLTNLQIVEEMQKNPELNFRKYTKGSIECRKARLGLKRNNKSSSPETRDRMKQLLKEQNKTLINYNNALSIEVKCNHCDHQFFVSTSNIEDKYRCPVCALNPEVSQDIYIIEFPAFLDPSVKVGRTRDFDMRAKEFPSYKFVARYGTDLKTADACEKFISEQYGLYKTYPNELHLNGITECYDISMTDQIHKSVKEFLNV